MALRQSIIQSPPRARTVAIREEYIGICAEATYPNCCAALLSLFEHWTNFKFEQREEQTQKNRVAKANNKPTKKLPSLWVYMPKENIKAELFDLFGETLIAKSLKWLEQRGFIRTRHNREKKWDRTLQYLLKINVVQKALFQWAHSSDAPETVRTACMSYKYGMHGVIIRLPFRTTQQAIPQESTQDTKKNISAIADDVPVVEEKQKRVVKRSEIFIALARESFNIFNVEELDKSTVILVNKLERWLKDNSPGATVQTLMAFYKWYDDTVQVSRPRDEKKFGARFNEFKQQKLAAAAKRNSPQSQEAEAREARNKAKAEEQRKTLEAAS